LECNIYKKVEFWQYKDIYINKYLLC